MNVTQQIAAALPRSVRLMLRRSRERISMLAPQRRSHAEIFSEIYRTGTWLHQGAKDREFCSGIGSAEEFTRDYARLIAQFITEHQIKTVVDLGCGDFQVGQRILDLAECHYVGVDVVPDLIARNAREFGSERVSFLCRDISRDPLPDGELCLIRQVLQHLDNDTTLKVLANTCKYRFCIVTESQLNNPKTYNLDIRSGACTRTLFGSGLHLDQPPFSRKIVTLLKTPRDATSVIHTCLLTH